MDASLNTTDQDKNPQILLKSIYSLNPSSNQKSIHTYYTYNLNHRSNTPNYSWDSKTLCIDLSKVFPLTLITILVSPLLGLSDSILRILLLSNKIE